MFNVNKTKYTFGNKILILIFISNFILFLIVKKRLYDVIYEDRAIKKNIEKISILENENRGKMTSYCNELMKERHKNVKVLEICFSQGYMTTVPLFYNRLPHIVHQQNGLSPIILHSKNKDKNSVRIVMGMVSVKRASGDYIYSTLASLIENMSVEERERALIVVLITEMTQKRTYINEVMLRLLKEFPISMEEGLIEVVTPHDSYYPPLSHFTTLGDNIQRMRWRTKQNLDYIYLMLYCMERGTYYLQLEDDVVTTPSYFSKMEDFVKKKSQKSWPVLEFSKMGFIGKLFDQENLASMLTFLLMFYDDKPGDWLLNNFIDLRACQEMFSCKSKLFHAQYPRSLFQHVGIHSSLKGKIQKIKAKDFLGKTLYVAKHPSNNPKAIIESSFPKLKSSFSLQDIYDFQSMDQTFNFVLNLIKSIQYIQITFDPPVFTRRFTIICDGSCKELDQNALLEVLYENNLTRQIKNSNKNLTLISTLDKNKSDLSINSRNLKTSKILSMNSTRNATIDNIFPTYKKKTFIEADASLGNSSFFSSLSTTWPVKSIKLTFLGKTIAKMTIREIVVQRLS